MFENIGRKIKALAKVICWIGIIASVVVGVIIIYDWSVQSYRYRDSAELITGIVVIILGSLLSWVGSFVLYGFGELVENSTFIAETMEENKQRNHSGEWFCKKCGNLNKEDTTVCNKCGTKR